MDAPLEPDFGDVHAAAVERLVPLLALSLDDFGLAQKVLGDALVRLRRRWPRRRPESALFEAHRLAFDAAVMSRRFRPQPEPIGPATIAKSGEAVTSALAELPVRQRSALLGRVRMGWTTAEIARAHGVEESTIELRIDRAIDQLAKQVGDADALDTIAALEPESGPSSETQGDLARETIERRARRHNLGSRATAVAAGLVLIAATGAIVRAATRPSALEPAVVETVAAPRASEAPHAPIGDERGGFVALGAGPGRIARSPDGLEWFPGGHLNPNRIDLRLFVERFFRSGGRYVALIESTTGGNESLTGTDLPRVAVADRLGEWELLDLDPGELTEVEGLATRIDLVHAAVVGDRVLLAANVDYEIDYVGLGIRPRDIAAIVEDRAGLALHRVEGSTIRIDSAQLTPGERLRLFVSDGGADFVEVPVDPNLDGPNPYSLFSYDGQFALLDQASATLYASPDGARWTALYDLGISNRLGLAAGHGARAVVVAPSAQAWRSTMLDGQGQANGTVPVDIDPATIWIKPQLAHGPAGWAMFITTSRPWELGDDDDFGWAVPVGDWVVELKAGRGTIVARSDTETHTFMNLADTQGRPRAHPDVVRGMFGGVQLHRPGGGDLLVQVSGSQIRDSWITGEDSAAAPTGSVAFGEWSVSGNLRTGPITLARPDGSTSTWTDGFDFTDGDRSDGVETDRFAPGTAEPAIEFFDADGSLELRVPIKELSALDLVPVERDPDRVRALVAFSPDGVNWKRVWETTRDTWYGSVAVGDDEVLISVSGMAADPIRVPVDGDR